MIDHTGPEIQVKAAGGVRDLETLRKVKQMGVTRCGASGTPAILDPLRAELGMPRINTSTSQNTPQNPNY